jgi:hypothetical protein
MPFGITGFGAEIHFIEISEAEFQRLKLAKNQLASSLAIEAKFDLVLGNYAEFEHEILILAAQKMVYSGLSWSSMHVDTQKVNRRVVNLLSAGRLYIDQTKHEAHSLGERPLVELLQETASQQYRAKLGYRALEELRNYTQHRDLPVHGLKYQSAWVNDHKNLTYRAVPVISVQRLREDSQLKHSIIGELKAIGDNVPLTPLVREYVEGLSVVHEEFRKHTEGQTAQQEAMLRGVQDRWIDEVGNGHSVRIVALDAGGQCTEEEAIFEEFITRRKELAQNNAVLINLRFRFPSGACDLHEDASRD